MIENTGAQERLHPLERLDAPDDRDRLAAALQPLREDYAIQENPIPDAAHRAAMNAFIFWASWSTVTNRPGEDVTYTSNWPHEPLVGNALTDTAAMWSMVSVILLLAGIVIGGLIG